MTIATDFLNFWSTFSVYSRAYASSFKLLSSQNAPENQSACRRSTVQDSREVLNGCHLLSGVASHDKPLDCWIVVKDKVYDVSSFAERHPGGAVISSYFGRDATDEFATFHPNYAWRLLQTFYIGDIVREDPKDYQELSAQFAKDQLPKSSILSFAFQTLTNAALFTTSIAIFSVTKSYWAVLVSAMVMGWFVQRCGWLSHEFLDQQVFESRSLNTFFGYLFGNLLLGFSVSWWRTSLRHSPPYECNYSAYTLLDEDMDTLPIIAWSQEILAAVKSRRLLQLLHYQHYALVPLLFLAHACWMFGSALFTSNPELSPFVSCVELGTGMLHYVWVAWLAFRVLPGWGKPLAWMVGTEFVARLGLGFVCTLGRNGKEVYHELVEGFRECSDCNYAEH